MISGLHALAGSTLSFERAVFSDDGRYSRKADARVALMGS
jgi:hypothetical protein